MNISDITEKEFIDNIDFVFNMVQRNGTTFRITREDGSKVMMIPIRQYAAPVDPDVLEQVEEFRSEWLARLKEQNNVPQETRNPETNGQE